MDFTTTPATGGGYVGRYTSALLRRQYAGNTNIAVFTNLEGGETEDADKSEEDIITAEDEIDQEFANSIYTIPFVATGADLPAMLRRWATVLSVDYSYDRRKGHDDKPTTLSADVAKVRREIAKYRAGFPKQLQGVTLNSGVSVGAVAYNRDTNTLSDGSSTGSVRRIGYRFIQGYGWVAN